MDPEGDGINDFKQKLKEWKETGEIERSISKSPKSGIKTQWTTEFYDRLTERTWRVKASIDHMWEEKENQIMKQCSFSPDLTLTQNKEKRKT